MSRLNDIYCIDTWKKRDLKNLHGFQELAGGSGPLGTALSGKATPEASDGGVCSVLVPAG
jgi:hypothetical protein